MAFVKTEVCPACQDSKPAQDRGSVCSKDDAADGVQEEEKSREMLHAHLDDASEDGYCMFGYKLFKGNEEGRLDRDSTTYSRKTGRYVSKSHARRGNRQKLRQHTLVAKLNPRVRSTRGKSAQ